MIWIILTVLLALISLYHWLEYHRAITAWNAMTSAGGQLLEFQLNPKTKSVKQIGINHSSKHIERITKKPSLLYSYEFQGETYQSNCLCLLDEVDPAVLDLYSSPKPIDITVYVNPDIPQESSLHLGSLSFINLFSSYLAALFIVYIGHRYFG